MKVVIALGGNALGNTPQEQIEKVKVTAKSIVDLIEEGHDVIIGHGNGPQVGKIKLAFDTASEPSISNMNMPFTECGAMSQGYIGYHLQQSIRNEMKSRGLSKEVATVLTQVIVDEKDKAFEDPSKPVGPFYSKEHVDDFIKNGSKDVFIEDAGRGYRKVIASPKPIKIVELPVIKNLVESGVTTITVGGGGIPVVLKDGDLIGVEAVIDKDFSSSLLARELNADALIILTAVNKVSINFNQPNQEDLSEIALDELDDLISAGHFKKGSMLEKIIACKEFVAGDKKRIAVVTSLENAVNALKDDSGTKIYN